MINSLPQFSNVSKVSQINQSQKISMGGAFHVARKNDRLEDIRLYYVILGLGHVLL